MQRIRRLFARARLEKEEVNILRGILGACEKRIQPSEPVVQASENASGTCDAGNVHKG
jgi:tRNA/rRNA methyltransferase